MKPLDRSFYARDTIDVAVELLGRTLVHRPPGGPARRGRIVETEAYLGPEDPASHSFGHRRTPRVEAMYGEPGTSYVYFIYGVYHCLNVVTVARDVAEAVLIRALEPIDNLPADPRVASGPGKLCRAMGLTRAHDRLDLVTGRTLWIEDGDSPIEVVSAPRVGLGDRHDAVHWPLRFGVRGSPALSKPRFVDQP